MPERQSISRSKTPFPTHMLKRPVADILPGAQTARRADHRGHTRGQTAGAPSSWATAVALASPVMEGAEAGSHALTFRQRLLSQEIFRSALIRERKRADRFDQLFAHATVAMAGAENGGGAALPAGVTAALVSATRETDLVGWVQQDVVLGVTYAELTPGNDHTARELKARLERQLERRVGAAMLANLQVRWYFHTAPGSSGADGLSDDDPLGDDLRSAQERRTMVDRYKRALDLAGSSLLLALLSPLFLLLAVMVRLGSPGPILFRQTRVGHLGKPFTILKFRTMDARADPAVHQQYITKFIKAGAPAVESEGEKVFKIVKDTRVTKVGRILRRTSLDELPQLWNVFRGDMSLVGPRPPLRYELEQYRPWHWRRVLEGKPGLTGLWQVTGRSRTTFDEMVRLDIRYVRSRSIQADVRILLATPRAVLLGKGAV